MLDDEDRPRDDGVGAPPPPLAPGARLGRYEIKDLLGSGGMGTVYRALDPALHREVAIKALAETFRDDAASLRRFEREARLLASLNHPNVAAIYGFEILDGAPYLILERIDGETLAQRLRRGPLPLREAVAVARQVADGLAEAHGKGVVHRDLKPSNVMLTTGGRVKLVDFGLAKASAPLSWDDGASAQVSATGTVVGTAPYMSPEQVHGTAVDGRTDVWAFGCLLYEMITGRGAFPGRSVPEVLAAVLRDEPDWGALPSATPPALSRLLGRCLRKEPAERLQHIGDARLDLDDVSAERPSAPTKPHRAGAAPRALPWLAGAAALAAAAAGLALLARRGPAEIALRLSVELPRGLTLASEYDAPFAISPSGALLVVEAFGSGPSVLFQRRLDDVTPTPIPGTQGGRSPFFSPDGRSVAFFADRKLKKVALDGGPVVDLCEIGSNERGGAWAPDGTIVIAPSQTSGLQRLSAGGSKTAPLTTLDAARGESSHRWPEVLPGGRWVLFTAAVEGSTYDEARVDAVSLATGERRAVLPNASFGRWVPGGYLLFVHAGQLYAIRFDPDTLKTRGSPELVLSGVRYDPQNGAAHFAVSATGTLVYGPGVPFSPEVYLAWLSRDGRLTRVSETPRMFRDPRLSPEGRRIAVVVGPAAESDLWLADPGTGALTRLSFGLAPRRPTWTPDGAGITVGVEKNGAWSLVTLAADGVRPPATLFTSTERIYPSCWSRDGRHLVFQQRRVETGWDLLVLDVDASGRAAGPPRPIAASPFQEANAALSADGRWLAYESDELDALAQAQVASFPDGGWRMRASTSGARLPVWGAGGELTYFDTSMHRILASATGEKGGRLAIEPPRPVFPGEGPRPPALAHVVITLTGGRYDIEPTSGRFLVLETSNRNVDPPLSRPVVVPAFARELAKKLRS